jgi:ADP-ribose pyrophosphatase YjhB (NUDIX family)
MEKKLTIRVRLILLCSDHVLVVRHLPTNTNFMPGGGLEHGESSIDCLHREFAEECDLLLPNELQPFGIIENRFTESNRDIHEVLIHFSAVLQNLLPPAVNSREPELEFRWISIATLRDTEIWPPETYNAIHSAYSNTTRFYHAPLERTAN